MHLRRGNIQGLLKLVHIYAHVLFGTYTSSLLPFGIHLANYRGSASAMLPEIPLECCTIGRGLQSTAGVSTEAVMMTVGLGLAPVRVEATAWSIIAPSRIR